MDLASVCAAFGLSAASGLNAWLPLFAGALLNRLDVVDLAAPFDDLSGTGWIVALGVLTAADFIGDKIPAVDHVLHAVGSGDRAGVRRRDVHRPNGRRHRRPDARCSSARRRHGQSVRRPRRGPAALHRHHRGRRQPGAVADRGRRLGLPRGRGVRAAGARSCSSWGCWSRCSRAGNGCGAGRAAARAPT